MPDKGVIIYYKHLKILEEAQLSDEQIGRVLGAAVRYDESGIIPKFDSTLSALFTMIKYDLDANRVKYEAKIFACSEAGKRGGRPTKTNEPDDSDGVKDKVRNAGYLIDQLTAKRISDCGLAPEWLNSPNSFLDFVAERIKELYGNKTDSEQKALFISAVRTWDDLRDEYPSWKAKKEKQSNVEVKRAKIEIARNNLPECCGSELVEDYKGSLYCRKCQISWLFSEDKLQWVKE